MAMNGGQHICTVTLVGSARAKMRLAEEYDAAQQRDEVAKQGAHISEGKMRASDILPPKELHEARKLRDAERESPGLIQHAWQVVIPAGNG